jgi:hypothetical protein
MAKGIVMSDLTEEQRQQVRDYVASKHTGASHTAAPAGGMKVGDVPFLKVYGQAMENFQKSLQPLVKAFEPLNKSFSPWVALAAEARQKEENLRFLRNHAVHHNYGNAIPKFDEPRTVSKSLSPRIDMLEQSVRDLRQEVIQLKHQLAEQSRQKRGITFEGVCKWGSRLHHWWLASREYIKPWLPFLIILSTC